MGTVAVALGSIEKVCWAVFTHWIEVLQSLEVATDFIQQLSFVNGVVIELVEGRFNR